MNIQTFKGADLKKVSLSAQMALGDDAMIIRTRVHRGRAGTRVEVVAAEAQEVERLRRRLEPKPLMPPVHGVGSARPKVVALVGPTGAGKTTTLVKLAINPIAFGSWKVGLLTIDTFRTGAVDQLEAYAAVAGLPLEVVYRKEEAKAALDRLSHCDVVLVDSPGRSPRHEEHNATWMRLLEALSPDEVHLVIPASMRVEAAIGALASYTPLGVSHFLVTKLDEVAEDAGLADAAIELHLPARWVTDGQEIPVDLHAAVQRVLASLGGYSGATHVLSMSA
jgi:flagellar biosynthesis protein FlhF